MEILFSLSLDVQMAIAGKRKWGHVWGSRELSNACLTPRDLPTEQHLPPHSCHNYHKDTVQCTIIINYKQRCLQLDYTFQFNNNNNPVAPRLTTLTTFVKTVVIQGAISKSFNGKPINLASLHENSNYYYLWWARSDIRIVEETKRR